LPVFGLFDYDPYGIDILKCYRSGSKVSAREADLNLPNMHWLGIRSADVVGLTSTSALLSLTQSDRRRATKLMQSMLSVTGEVPDELNECRSELQSMLLLGCKAEIQILGDGIGRWTEQKMLDIMSR
jgi:meiotic recombination protein SPO11